MQESLSKDNNIRLSSWSSSSLTTEKKTHACLDAKKILEICNKISHLSNLSLRLNKVECTEGLIVDVAPFYGSISTMMQRATKAEVTQKEKIHSPPSTNQKEQSVTNKTVNVQTLQAYSPNSITPGLSKDRSKSNVILCDFEEAPFHVRLPCRMLMQHSLHDVPSSSESTIEHRSNSFHFFHITKLSDILLNGDAPIKVEEMKLK